MTDKSQFANDPALSRAWQALRWQAEALASDTMTLSPEVIAEMTPEDTQLLFHEMRLYQVELEMQAEQLRQTQVALGTERARYLDLYDFAPVGYCTVSASGLISQSNLAGATFLGLNRIALLGLPISRFILKDDLERYDRLSRQLIESGQTQSCELRLVNNDGTPCWAFLTATVAQDEAGAPVQRLVLNDISALKQAEHKIKRLSRIYAALSHANEAVVRSTNESELFAQICRAMVQFGGLRMAWIGLLDEASQEIRPVASFGEGNEFLTHLRISPNRDGPFGHGPTADAIRENKPFWCQDFLKDPRTAARWELGARLSWAGSAALPLQRNGMTVGTFNLYAGEVDAFDQDMRSLLLEMAAVISFALDSFARQAAHQAQQTQLKLAAQVFAQSQEGITITDAHANIVMVNPAFARITGYTEAEVLGKNPRILTSGRQGREFYRTMWDTLNREGLWAGEIWNRRKDGTLYAEWLAVSALHDANQQVSHYLGSFSDLSHVKAAENQIQWLSHFDPVTGLPNSALLQDRTRHSISMAQRAGEPLTLMLIGIDHFKHINDALGHQSVDTLLMEIAKRLTLAVREQDTVSHLGDKEFVLVLPGTPASGAAHLAAELLWKLAEPYDLGDQETTLTASIGIASYPDNGSDFDSLIKAVEIAMHRAQANGRDTFEFYSEDLYQQVVARDHMLKALRNADALDQLQLVYQPLVDLQTGQISGLEALLRWQHPELGAVSPVQFIPLAEEAGLIKNIGAWVLRRACRDLRVWLDKGIKIPHVAVNVSPLQFGDSDLIGQVKTILADYQIDPAYIYLEVTEGALMADVPRSETMLKEFKSMGLKLALDDFGTGYSSLSYLKRFPFDKIKIDQSFVRDVTTNENDNVLVNVIISMAHGLGLKVIAEGVETEAQCEFMRTSICDEIQGYFFSRPISAQAIEELIAEGRQLPPHLLRLQKPQRTLLLVDDEPNIVAALKRLFRRDGHVILTANSGPEGLQILSQHKVDVIVSDQRMPGMTGVEFLRAAKIKHPDTIRIVLSGYTELQSVTDAINEGAIYRFLTKPWEDDQLREHVLKAFEYKELQDENRQLDIKIRTSNQELVAANRQLGDVLHKTHQQISRNETSLAIMREALQYIPLPVIGVDEDGLMAFANAAAEQLFKPAGPLLGVELADALPAIDTAMADIAEGVSCERRIEGNGYRVQWNSMGSNSRSRGRLITFTPSGPG